MKWKEWFARRGPAYVYQRAAVLMQRYRLSPATAAERIERCVKTLAEHGCAPTFPTPGCIVERYPGFIRHVQELGAEIAVHSYDHIDLSVCDPATARQQLERAISAFDRHAIAMAGFRAPYLSCTEELLAVLPAGMFDYSSNAAIWCDVVPAAVNGQSTTVYATLEDFYHPRPASEAICMPWTRDNLVEIPATVPDDIQLHDGLQLGPAGIAAAWQTMLQHTSTRGELFVLHFHPELAEICRPAFVAVLREANRLRPRVWHARLRDISTWWREKAAFRATLTETADGLRIDFACSDRATILVRGLDLGGIGEQWDGAYLRLDARSLALPGAVRPLVGLPADAPAAIVHFLREQGYILDQSPAAVSCTMFLDHDTLSSLCHEVALVDYIETNAAPLVRYWRWPNAAKSALSVTGDLDALTLGDYGSRLLTRV